MNTARKDTVTLVLLSLGTRRVMTGPSGVVEQNCMSLPYGDSETCIPLPAENLYTGKEKDEETQGGVSPFGVNQGNDYFGARYYASTAGRWLSPDPSQLYYADPTNPQSMNLYSYVEDNPMVFVDPSGLWLQIRCSSSSGTTSDSSSVDPMTGQTLTSVHVTSGDQNCFVYDDGAGDYKGYIPMRPLISYVPSNSKDPCSNPFLDMAGVDAKQQIATAQAYIAGGQAAAGGGPYKNPFVGFLGGMVGYYEAVHTGGPNDIKDMLGHSRQNPIDVNAGNISFGITCPYGAGFCQFAAGFAQSVIGRDPDFNGTLATGFDTPSDNAGIRTGQAMRAAGCHE